jgi:hypothetical protein
MLTQVIVMILAAWIGPTQDDGPTATRLATIQRGGIPVCEVLEWRHGSDVASSLVCTTALPQDEPAVSDQTLTTTVHDSENPDEPWIVTTHRRRDESQSAFIKRHREMVGAVRDALGPAR